jgi:hypothetical protein
VDYYDVAGKFLPVVQIRQLKSQPGRAEQKQN